MSPSGYIRAKINLSYIDRVVAADREPGRGVECGSGSATVLRPESECPLVSWTVVGTRELLRPYVLLYT